ncbi:MAG: ABC transporter ATP-binding protein [Alphaproteobacteria bacterium]|nr:ABC transporter ATP-binding protein [Alphaproteobacteria bacterium]
METILQVNSVSRKFGGLVAVNDVSFSVKKHEILSVIGPNGAGKSTLFKLISSFMPPSSGDVTFMSQRISGLAPHIVARKGVVRTFQETTIFRNMTVRETVVVAHHLRSRANLVGYYFGTRLARKDEREFGQSADEILGFLNLSSMADEQAINLPHGHLRALGIAMGLATNPKILLLDEPFAGMNNEETMRAVQMVRNLRENRGLTVLLVEHDMPAVMQISDRIVVLNFGQKIAEGTPHEIQHNPAVIEAYLGTADETIGM